jgi:hypothetical protein
LPGKILREFDPRQPRSRNTPFTLFPSHIALSKDGVEASGEVLAAGAAFHGDAVHDFTDAFELPVKAFVVLKHFVEPFAGNGVLCFSPLLWPLTSLKNPAISRAILKKVFAEFRQIIFLAGSGNQSFFAEGRQA